MYTPEELKNQLANARRHVEELEQALAGKSGGGGGSLPPRAGGGEGNSGTPTPLEQAVAERERLAAEFYAMRPAERLQLYREQPEVWERMMRAVERQGMAKLGL